MTQQTIHILGICGTFMGGIAQIAKQAGYRVYGSDQHVYPPMSTQLEQAGIELISGYDNVDFAEQPDMVVVGNAMSRGNPAVELLLQKGLVYTSGPQWLYEQVLHDKWVLAIAGTHGKTSTSSMLAWILDYAGFNPGFLIGGVPQNFGLSARLGVDDDNDVSRFFVIEADEYDTAFFDKRSKFLHYHPKTLVINNLEFDHADIFENLAAIQKQFHYLNRIVPPQGKVLYNDDSEAVAQVMQEGCWSAQASMSVQQDKQQNHWYANKTRADASAFTVHYEGEMLAELSWDLIGEHNMQNALSAIAAAHHIGILPAVAADALSQFKTVKRRLEQIACVNQITIYDDFAHHPTAIATTLTGLRAKVGQQRILAVLEPRSNTMKMGVHNQSLEASLLEADHSYLFVGDELSANFASITGDKLTIANSIDVMIKHLQSEVQPGDHIVIMSNGGFQGIHQKLKAVLEQQYEKSTE